MSRPPLSAAVLAGGKSSRMGTDKALLPLVPGGKPMVELVLDRLRAMTDDLLVVAPQRPGYGGFGARIVPDLFAGGGALVGIHSALAHAVHAHCIVVACDMPFLSAVLLERMASEPRDYDVFVPFVAGTSRQGGGVGVYQTLHAIFGKRCLPEIEAQLAAEDRRVVGFFSRVAVRTIDADEIAIYDPSRRAFFNANSPEAFAEAQSIMRSR